MCVRVCACGSVYEGPMKGLGLGGKAFFWCNETPRVPQKVGFLDKPLCSWRKGGGKESGGKNKQERERESERAKGQKGGRLTEKQTWWQPVQSD